MEPRRTSVRRLVGLDAARGAAMLLTCVSHFAWSLGSTTPAAAETLTLVGMVATPAFLLLSGAVVGTALERSDVDLHLLSWRLVDRGLFVIVIGHLLLAIALAHYSGGFGRAFENGRTTDAIGLAAVLMGFIVMRRLPIPPLWLLAVTAALGWAATISWHPTTALAAQFKWLLLGHLDDPQAAYRVAEHLVPYLAMYFFGVHVGRRVARPDAVRRVAAIGVVLAGAGVLAKVAGVACSAWIAQVPGGEWALSFAPTQKLPPSPAYMVFYGGLALLMLSWFLSRFGNGVLGARLTAFLVPVGRAALVVYVFQYFVYALVLPSLVPGFLRFWPLALAATLLPIWVLARWWSARDGNRWLTFGLVALRRARRGHQEPCGR